MLSRARWRPGRHLAGVAALLALTAGASWAGRPLDTEDPDTLEPGKVELQLGADHTRGGGDQAWTLASQLSLGVLPRVEVGIQGALTLLDRESRPTVAGSSDSIVSVKYRGLDETDEKPALAGEIGPRLPTGDASRGLGEPGVEVELLMIAAKNLGPVALGGNLGYRFATSGPDVWVLGVAVGYTLTDAWMLVGELVGTASTGRHRGTALIRGGVTYEVTKGITLDAAAAGGLTHDSPEVVLRMGVTFDF